MPNRLTSATSPYLLQHADNPVDRWEWSDEAFAEARRSDRPVLLSVGYAALTVPVEAADRSAALEVATAHHSHH